MIELLEQYAPFLDQAITVLALLTAVFSVYIAFILRGGTAAKAWKWIALGLVFLGISTLANPLHELLEVLMLISFFIALTTQFRAFSK